jgi:shikimate dehydrogenase
MPRLGVLGHPVAHSRSPAMHEAAYRALGLEDWRYQLLPVPPELFEETVRALPGAGFLGANVTIPHKEAALALSDEATAAARAIGAANTLTFSPDGAIHVENTDAPGLIAALPESPAGRSALVLGAGGSARAVVWALIDAGAAEVRVWNRTPERAEALTAEIGGIPVREAAPADLLVNCTAVGLEQPSQTFKELPIPAEAISDYRWVVDLVYTEGETALVSAALAAGATVIDGLEILVRQGALSFERWTGQPAPLDAMRDGARRGQSYDRAPATHIPPARPAPGD